MIIWDQQIILKKNTKREDIFMKRNNQITLVIVMVMFLMSLVSLTVFAATEITVSSLAGYPYNEAFPEIIKQFEEQHPDIKVNVEYYPYNKLLEITEVKLGARSSDLDVLFTDVPLVSSYTKKNYIIPLNKYFTEEEMDQWFDAAADASIINDELMAAPLNNSSQLLYYNKKIFEENGIQFPSRDPENRMTWKEIVDIAEQLTYDDNGDG